jgi:hypothetical protein
MLGVLYGINCVTINEIIHYNSFIGYNVFVIDVYRSPIEKKISLFFEDISYFHFNTTDENILTYKLSRVIERFNQVYYQIANGDHFIDLYNIIAPVKFDNEKKYLLLESNGVTYIKLRLQDSNDWDHILSSIFNTSIRIIRDYETNKKPICELYNKFKEEYKLPLNYYHSLEDCKYLKYFLSETERQSYLGNWFNKTTNNFIGFTKEEYILYETISNQNCSSIKIDRSHYADEGCLCEGCFRKRRITARNIMVDKNIIQRISHDNNYNHDQLDNITMKIRSARDARVKIRDTIQMMKKYKEIRMKRENRIRKDIGVNMLIKPQK